METDEYLTVADVATRLKVSQETVREWLRTDVLHGYNLGGRAGWRIPNTDIARLLESRSGKRPPTAQKPRSVEDR
jgi:excisionase family DNA binding protein